MYSGLILRNFVREKKALIKKCNLEENLIPGSFKVLENKSSASHSIIAFGELARLEDVWPGKYQVNDMWSQIPNKKVAMKISFPELSNDVGLNVEIAMYKQVSNALERHYTPNLTGFIDSWQCKWSDLLSGVSEANRAIMMKDFRKFAGKFYFPKFDIEPFLSDNARKLLAENQQILKQIYKRVAELIKQYEGLSLKQQKGIEGQEIDRELDQLRADRKPLEQYRDDILANEKREYQKLKIDQVFKTAVANVLITEKSQGLSLYEAVRDQILSQEDLLAVLFQIVYTLDVLYKLGVRQGDLHSGNVFVDRTDNSPSLAYVPEPRLSGRVDYYLIPGKWLAKIYDWDFGGIYSSKELDIVTNPDMIKYDTCSTQSSCGSNSKADLFRLLLTLYRIASIPSSYPQVAKLIETIIHPKILKDGRWFETYLSMPSVDKSKNQLDPNICPSKQDPNARLSGSYTIPPQAWQPLDCWVMSPKQILALPEFSKWKKAFTGATIETPYVYGFWRSNQEANRFNPYLGPSDLVDHIGDTRRNVQRWLDSLIEAPVISWI